MTSKEHDQGTRRRLTDRLAEAEGEEVKGYLAGATNRRQLKHCEKKAGFLFEALGRRKGEGAPKGAPGDVKLRRKLLGNLQRVIGELEGVDGRRLGEAGLKKRLLASLREAVRELEADDRRKTRTDSKT